MLDLAIEATGCTRRAGPPTDQMPRSAPCWSGSPLARIAASPPPA